jgi:phenylalanyl-tRNA synthetase alpha chain
MEGVRVFEGGVPLAVVERDLKDGLEGLARNLFGDVQMRWIDAYFPFTDPSFEVP